MTQQERKERLDNIIKLLDEQRNKLGLGYLLIADDGERMKVAIDGRLSLLLAQAFIEDKDIEQAVADSLEIIKEWRRVRGENAIKV